MRMAWSFLLLLATATVAHAEDHIVTAFAGPFRFEPDDLVIAVGDTVTFKNGGGFHNVLSDEGAVTTFRCADGCDGDGGNGDVSDVLWSATVAFPAEAVIGYHCEQHGASGGNGMSGLITVFGAVVDDAIFAEGFEAAD